MLAGLAPADDVGSSGLFDAAWYRRTQAPHLSGHADPVRHYLRHGARAGLNPGPLFDAAWYSAQNLDVAATGVNPLHHYVVSGRGEGRLTCAVADRAEVEAVRGSILFDDAWYRRTQAPALSAQADAAQHYPDRTSAAPGTWRRTRTWQRPASTRWSTTRPRGKPKAGRPARSWRSRRGWR